MMHRSMRWAGAGLVLVVLLGAGCRSERRNTTAEGIARELNARQCELHFGREDDARDALRYVELELSDVQQLKHYRSLEFVTSRAALRYFQELPADEAAQYDEVRVTVKGDGVSFSKAYRMADLPDVAAAVALAGTYLDHVQHKDLSALDAAYDGAYISDSASGLLRGLYTRIDSAQGPFISHALVGFALESGNNGTVPVVTVLEDAMVRDSVVYNFAVSVARSSRKIFHLRVE